MASNEDINQNSYQKDYQILKSIASNSKIDFSSNAHALFKKHVNPFEFFLACLSCTNIKDTSNSKEFFPVRLIVEFQNFLEVDNNKQKYSTLLTSLIQLKVFEILKKIKHNSAQYSLIKSFSLGSAPNILVPLLLEDLQKEKVKNTVNLIKMLEFGPLFDAKDLLIPLLLQNKIGVIEEFLKCDDTHRITFLQILDRIVGNELQIPDLIYTYEIRVIKSKECLKEKNIFKLGIRLMKKFGLPSETCPNIIIRHNKSSLRYLFCRHYNENGITLDSLLLFARELSEKNDALKKEVLNLFVDYYDYHSAILYLKEVHIQEADIPHQLKSYQMSTDCEVQSQKKIQDYSSNDYYQLNLPLKHVVMVSTISQFEEAVNYLSACVVIAVDTEWKPSHQFDEDEKLSLMQIASKDKIYLFDMINLPSILNTQQWNQLGMLFSSESILKLLYAFSGDKKQLGATNKHLKEHVNMMANTIDFDVIKLALLECSPNIYAYTNVDHKGLSELVYLCFGKPLNKIEQCSYWAVRPLSNGQVIYSALDAYCLIEIYNYLNEKAKDLNISDWKYLKPTDVGNTRRNNSQNNVLVCDKKNRALLPHHGMCVYASAFRVVCDSMLQGLGKLLRFCNIDTAILNPEDSHEKCIEYFQEKRIILTRGNVYHRLRKVVPESHIYCVKNAVPKMQLQELVSHFQIIIIDSDIFARCATCNSNEYLYLEPAVMSKMKNYASNYTACNANTKTQWFSVKGGKVDILKGVTNRDIAIKHREIPFQILNSVRIIYVCSGCGKCYWDGSHMDRFLKDISNVIKKSHPSAQCHAVPPP